jgi:hypothetical protein
MARQGAAAARKSYVTVSLRKEAGIILVFPARAESKEP